ncbi:MAG: T9SS type A sorting domain-containing protein [Bacteroidetes bacterium]|nr:T9SS type A sorting domain-containing protein [Bacteroidota bacterium]
MRLMDLSGRIIYQQPSHEITAGKLNLEIPVKGLNAGIYIVNLITEKDNISGKVIVLILISPFIYSHPRKRQTRLIRVPTFNLSGFPKCGLLT